MGSGTPRTSGEGAELGGGDAPGAPRRHGPRVMASAPSVVQQARLMDSAGTAWHAVKYGNLEMITKLFPNKCNVYARGPVGENVFHTAMLLNTPSTLAIARYLIKLYGPPLVNCPFTERKTQASPPSSYEGQTALHIAIVNKDIDMVKFLVQAGADIRARAWGPFFGPGGPMHYGEYPLSFAACTGQKEVVAYLKRHGASVNGDRDMQGNTALHMCVMHDQKDMYDFLVEYCAASDAVRNYSGLTPLVLAAQQGKMDMFQHIYNRRRRAFYTFGKITSYSLALREIDTVQDEEEYVPNALEVVLRKGHLEMLEEPLIKTLLKHKWEAFARTQFLLHLLGYLCLEVSQTVLIWLISSKEEWNGTARASQEYVGLTLAIIMAAYEILDYVDWSRECYHRRLAAIAVPAYHPPLYPIPGEERGAAPHRQGIFHRLSQRVMGGLGLPHAGGGQSMTSSMAALPSFDPFDSGVDASAAAAVAASAAAAGSGGGGGGGGGGAFGGAGAVSGRQPNQPQAPLGGTRRFERPLSITDTLPAPAPPGGRPHVSFAEPAPPDVGGAPGGGGGSGGGARPLGEAREPRINADDAAAARREAEAARAAAAAPASGAAVSADAGAAAEGGGTDDEEEPDLVSVGVTQRRSLQQATSAPTGAIPGPGGASPPRAPRPAAPGELPPPSPARFDSATGAPAVPGAAAAAPGVHPLAHRTKSYHGSGTGAAGVSTGSASGLLPTVATAPGGLSAMARAGSKPVEIQMGESPFPSNPPARQRTRARSGGGDLPTSVSALKRPAAGGADAGGGGGGGAGGGGGEAQWADLEAGGGADDDPHKGRLRAMLETTTEGFMRMLSDPWLFIWHTHLALTFMHFITWQTTYGGVGGAGPASRGVREFDDIVVSLMGLSGWLAVIYFFRGFKPTGKLAVILERCLVDVVRFISLYILWNIGFTLAFFTMTRGTLYVTDTPRDKDPGPLMSRLTADEDPGVYSIGWGMMGLINLGLGLGLSEYKQVCDLGHEVTSVFCTIYYLAYMATSAILLLNLLTAMIIRTYNTAQKAAEAHWRRRWALYCVKAERRMPSRLIQRLRLGQPAWDPARRRHLYSHIFEEVEGDDRARKEDRGAVDAQIKALTELLDSLRRQKGAAGGGGGGTAGPPGARQSDGGAQ